MADLREKFEINSSLYSVKYHQLHDLFHELYGSLKMGNALVFNAQAKQEVEEKMAKATAVLVDCVNLLGRMWMYSIVTEPVAGGALWGDLKENRKPIHLFISKEETDELAHMAMQLAKLCQEAHSAKLIEDKDLVEDLDAIVTVVNDTEMVGPGSNLYPSFDVNNFPTAETLPESSDPDDDMVAIQNDPWSCVPVNPSLPETASSTKSADLKDQSENMYETVRKLRAIIPYYTQDSAVLANLYPLVYYDSTVKRYRMSIISATPNLIDAVDKLYESTPPEYKTVDEKDPKNRIGNNV